MISKFISPSVHGLLDYLVDITLIVIPFLMEFDQQAHAALVIPLVIGLSNLSYSLLTVYNRSVVNLIPFRFHLLLDYMAGITLLITPFLVPVSGFTAYFFFIMGVGIFVATLLTKQSD